MFTFCIVIFRFCPNCKRFIWISPVESLCMSWFAASKQASRSPGKTKCGAPVPQMCLRLQTRCRPCQALLEKTMQTVEKGWCKHFNKKCNIRSHPLSPRYSSQQYSSLYSSSWFLSIFRFPGCNSQNKPPFTVHLKELFNDLRRFVLVGYCLVGCLEWNTLSCIV